jgi:hypothetical protein
LDSTNRTVDYEYERIGLEITVLQEYLPRNIEIDRLLKRDIETNSRPICIINQKTGEIGYNLLIIL